MTRRDRALALGLAATLMASAWVATWPDPELPGAVAAVPPSDAGHRRPPPREPWPQPGEAALAAWAPPPSATEPVPTPAANVASEPTPAPLAPTPAAPPLPWRWLGRLDDAAGPRALVDGPGGARLVREHDVLVEHWRVEHIGTDQLRWTWLPGGLSLTLNRS